jgi:hypothetical protein
LAAENESHEGKRRVESQWPIFKLHHQRSRYVYDLYYKRHAISKELYEFLLEQGYADGQLIAKWKKASPHARVGGWGVFVPLCVCMGLRLWVCGCVRACMWVHGLVGMSVCACACACARACARGWHACGALTGPLGAQPGFENLCCLRCIQPKDTNFGTACVCRVPKNKYEEGKVIECVHCGCRGCCG